MGEDKVVIPPAVLRTVVRFNSVFWILSGIMGNVKKSIVFPWESVSSKEQRYTSKSLGNIVANADLPTLPNIFNACCCIACTLLITENSSHKVHKIKIVRTQD